MGGKIRSSFLVRGARFRTCATKVKIKECGSVSSVGGGSGYLL